MSSNSNTPISTNGEETNIEPQKNTMTEFSIKQRNIGANGAYTTAQRLKVMKKILKFLYYYLFIYELETLQCSKG
jgi:hypothetical protein